MTQQNMATEANTDLHDAASRSTQQRFDRSAVEDIDDLIFAQEIVKLHFER